VGVKRKMDYATWPKVQYEKLGSLVPVEVNLNAPEYNYSHCIVMLAAIKK